MHIVHRARLDRGKCNSPCASDIEHWWKWWDFAARAPRNDPVISCKMWFETFTFEKERQETESFYLPRVVFLSQYSHFFLTSTKPNYNFAPSLYIYAHLLAEATPIPEAHEANGYHSSCCPPRRPRTQYSLKCLPFLLHPAYVLLNPIILFPQLHEFLHHHFQHFRRRETIFPTHTSALSRFFTSHPERHMHLIGPHLQRVRLCTSCIQSPRPCLSRVLACCMWYDWMSSGITHVSALETEEKEICSGGGHGLSGRVFLKEYMKESAVVQRVRIALMKTR